MVSALIHALVSCLLFAAVPFASHSFLGKPFATAADKRNGHPADPLTVDLEYEVYQGVKNDTTGLYTFLGYNVLPLQRH